MGWWFKRSVQPIIEQAVKAGIKAELPKILDAMIPGIMRERFKREPDRTLSSIGFSWALILAFEDAWPDIDRPAAISCARDCLEIPYGTDGYDWTATAAQELVRDYVSTYGESS